MLSNQPAKSFSNNIIDISDSDPLTDFRTTTLDNNLDFEVGLENLNLKKFIDNNNTNIQQLNLPAASSSKSFPSRPKCNVTFNPSTRFACSDNTTIQPEPIACGIPCPICKRIFKGRRGLHLHYGRSSNCKRKVPSNITNSTDDDHTPNIPDEVRNTVKGPSTTVESLESMCGDGNDTKIHKHNSKHGCNLCHILSTKDRFVSSSTHRVYESVIPEEVPFVSCNSSNVIYLVTCRKCCLQYVGETAQLLRERIRHHNYCTRHPDKDHTCRILSEHFSQGLCKGATFTVHIMEKLHGNGRDAEGTIDPAITAVRRKKETDWMLKLRTVFPHGLNDRIGDDYMSDKDLCNIYSKFPPLKRVKDRHRIRSKNYISSQFISKHFIYILNESFRTNLKNTMNLIRTLLSSLRKSSCKLLLDSINEYLLSKHDSYLYTQYFRAALDILSSKVDRIQVQPKVKSLPSNRCHIKFDNKAVDFINLQQILHNKDVIKSLPPGLRKDSPMVVYDLTNTIRSKIFNYKSFIQSINIVAFLSDNTTLPCDCHNSPFVNYDHNHVITGNLEIVSNPLLRNMLSKGPKYREPVRFSCRKAKVEIINGINKCISSWSNRSGVSELVFEDWRLTLIQKIDNRILALSKNQKQLKSIFEDVEVQNCLSNLQDRYVMVPIDKAANNVAFICKRFYVYVIMKELGLLGEQSPTYSIIDLSPDNIIDQHKFELKEKFNITIDQDNLVLPDIYWTPKLHKNPVKFRFIIASKQCTIKHLSKNMSSIFSLFMKQIETYNKKARYYSGINSYWIVHNRDPIMKTVNKSVSRKSAKCISSFDFSTLYTKIPHDKLIDVLHHIIDFAFKGGTRKKIGISRNGIAYWVSCRKPTPFAYTKDLVANAASFLIKNSYFKFGDKLFRQDIGIPMGSDPAPCFANLFLYHYESSWIKSIKKTDNILARKFGNVFRYIDDLLAINDGHSFESFFRDIYPGELELSKENILNTETNFLDLHIKIVNGTFTTMLYDKRDHFGFDITRLPHRSSNIPHKMFYSSITAECLRICRATSSDAQAIESIKILLDRMIHQGGDIQTMKKHITKAFVKHHIDDEFGITGTPLVIKIFD